MKNNVSLLGRVGGDPEHGGGNGKQWARISVATSEKWTDKNDGQVHEKTEWHRCVAFARTAEIIGNYVRKGDLVGVEGKISYGNYEKDGVKHYTTDIMIQRVILLSPKGDRGNNQSKNKKNDGSPQYDKKYTADNIPF